MKVLFVSAEVAPFAKVGGLADVAGSLPKALAERGHTVTVAMPAYQMILDDPRWVIEDVMTSFPVKISSTWTVDAWVKETWLGDVRVLLFGGADFFTKATSSETVYLPGIEQYLFFSHAVLEASLKLSLNLDVVHCNDWQTGLIPVLMREKAPAIWNKTAALYTIHNLAYQGEFDRDVLDKVELPQRLFNSNQLETWGRLNFLKAGCVYADQVNTVSPTYAKEIQTPRYGCALEGLMIHLAKQRRLSGILNGIDTETFNPMHDPALPNHFDADDLSGKVPCKARLQSELGLPVKPATPLMAIVSRLSTQKGLDLVLEIAPQLADLPGQLVVQGLGDPWIAGQLRELAAKFPENVAFVERFDADLAQRIYAGSDIFLMPSAFEPCGLGQMIAMRYGTVPIVRQTGGLADTVFENENGFVFENSSAEELWSAIDRANQTFQNITNWGQFILAGMKDDLTWTKSAGEYETLYRIALGTQAMLGAAAS